MIHNYCGLREEGGGGEGLGGRRVVEEGDGGKGESRGWRVRGRWEREGRGRGSGEGEGRGGEGGMERKAEG